MKSGVSTVALRYAAQQAGRRESTVSEYPRKKELAEASPNYCKNYRALDLRESLVLRAGGRSFRPGTGHLRAFTIPARPLCPVRWKIFVQ